jgi:hypothetical protein
LHRQRLVEAPGAQAESFEYRLMGFAIWKASTVLPAEMIDALRPSNKPRGVAA